MDPSERGGSLDLARHYLEIGQPKRALDTLEKSDVDPRDEELHELRAHAFFDLGRHQAAADVARAGLAEDPENISLLETLALAELELDHADAAERAISQAIELAPWWGALHAQRAFILARNDRFDEARAAVAEARRLDADSPHVLQVHAQVEVLADSPDAREAVDELLAIDPDNRVGHLLRGDLSAKKAEFGTALRHYGTAARFDPDDPNAAEAARESRVLAHPLLAPVRPMWRFGRWRSWILYLAIITTLAAAGLDSLRVVVALCWIVIVVLSWVGPPILRRWQRRRYGW